jgi:hypothetical protein
MVVKSARVVIGDEDNRVVPIRTRAHRIEDLSDKMLPCTNVTVGMLVVLARARKRSGRVYNTTEGSVPAWAAEKNELIGCKCGSVCGLRKLTACGTSE